MFAGLLDRTWLWFAAGFYLAGLVLGTYSMLRGGRQSNTRINIIIALGYLCQVIGLYSRGRETGGCPLGNTFEIFQFTAWSAITLYLIVGVRFRSSLLGYFTSCLAAVLTLTSLAIPAWDATRRTQIFGGNPWVELHASLALFSYGVFALLALTALLLLLRHLSLQRKHLGGWFSFLPPIVDLDHISLRLLITGVGFMTVAVLGGTSYWARDPSSVNVSKLIATNAVWLAYSLALVLRLRGHLIAKRFAWTCLVLFGAALLSLGPVDASRKPAPAPATPDGHAGAGRALIDLLPRNDSVEVKPAIPGGLDYDRATGKPAGTWGSTLRPSPIATTSHRRVDHAVPVRAYARRVAVARPDRSLHFPLRGALAHAASPR